jgi:hypothetical protein
MEFEKHLSPIISTEPGREIDCSDRHPESAFASIRVSFEQDSNVNDESDAQPERYLSPITSTKQGIQIDISLEQPVNAFASIRVSFESDSKTNPERPSQKLKEYAHRTSISRLNLTVESIPQ